MEQWMPLNIKLLCTKPNFGSIQPDQAQTNCLSSQRVALHEPFDEFSEKREAETTMMAVRYIAIVFLQFQLNRLKPLVTNTTVRIYEQYDQTILNSNVAIRQPTLEMESVHDADHNKIHTVSMLTSTDVRINR